jgi:hypothetical protein
VIKDKNMQQGKMLGHARRPAHGDGPNGQLFILNKRDGVIRLVMR